MIARLRRTSDSGFTLIELLIYMLLFGLVLSIAGAIVVNTARTSKTVTSVTEASAAGQLVAYSVEKGIRNSSDFNLTPVGSTDQFLVARTARNGEPLTWVCEAWYYTSAGNGSIRHTVSSTEIAAPTVADLATWTLLGTGIAPKISEGTPPVPIHVFEAADDLLTLSFSALAGDHPPVDITSSALSRAGATGSPACY
jgi:prepilin-type N-terminal cleavage/methylation domain-containing protein